MQPVSETVLPKSEAIGFSHKPLTLTLGVDLFRRAFKLAFLETPHTHYDTFYLHTEVMTSNFERGHDILLLLHNTIDRHFFFCVLYSLSIQERKGKDLKLPDKFTQSESATFIPEQCVKNPCILSRNHDCGQNANPDSWSQATERERW